MLLYTLILTLIYIENIFVLGHCSDSVLERKYEDCSSLEVKSKTEDPLVCQIISLKVEKCTEHYAECMTRSELNCLRRRTLQSLSEEKTGKLSDVIRMCPIYRKYQENNDIDSCW